MSRRFLLWRLSAPLATAGTRPGNDFRATDRWPARSGLTGLLGAALGVDRADEAGNRALEHDYVIGVAERALGETLVDFQTAQAVATSVMKHPATRRAALAHATPRRQTKTMVKQHEYLQGAVFDIAVTQQAGSARWTLEQVGEALRAPHWPLSFGRRSCPLDRPPGAQIVTAPTVCDAFDQYAAIRAEAPDASRAAYGLDRFLLEPPLAEGLGGERRRITRRDGVADRLRRAFTERDYVVLERGEAEVWG